MILNEFDEFPKYAMQERWIYAITDDETRNAITKDERRLIATDFY